MVVMEVELVIVLREQMNDVHGIRFRIYSYFFYRMIRGGLQSKGASTRRLYLSFRLAERLVCRRRTPYSEGLRSGVLWRGRLAKLFANRWLPGFLLPWAIPLSFFRPIPLSSQLHFRDFRNIGIRICYTRSVRFWIRKCASRLRSSHPVLSTIPTRSYKLIRLKCSRRREAARLLTRKIVSWTE
jgi:hypothetical protein